MFKKEDKLLKVIISKNVLLQYDNGEMFIL